MSACTEVNEVETSLSLTINGEDQKVSLKPNGDVEITFTSFEDSVCLDISSLVDWSVKLDNQKDETWCTITPMEGLSGTTQLTIKVKDNTYDSDRSSKIIVNSGSTIHNIYITQKAREPLSFGNSVILNENVRIYDSRFYSFVKSYNDSQVILNPSIPIDLMPKEGDIIVFPLPLSYRPAYIAKVSAINSQYGECKLDVKIPSMDDIFKEYTQNVVLNSSNVHVAIDPNSEGEDYECRIVDNSVWNDMDTYVVDDSLKSSISTKGSIGTNGIENIDFTTEISIKKKIFTGKIYIRIHGNIKMQSKSNADMTLHQQIGLKGDINWADVPSGRKSVPLLRGKKMPIMGTVLAGLVLKPELDLFYEGEIKVQSGVNCEIVNSDFTCNIRNKQVESASTIEKKRNIYFRVQNIYTKGEIGLSTTGALFYLVGDERLMSFGANLEAGVAISGEKSVGIQFPKIANFDFNVSVYPFLYISPWVQFSGKIYKKDKMVQFKGDPFLVSLLPTFAINQAQKINMKVSVDTDIDKQSFISSKDDGIALFIKDASTPIMKSSTSNSKAKSILTRALHPQNYDLTFNITDNKEYEIAPYIETADGDFVYGERVPVYAGWMEEFYLSTNGDNWLHNDNWLSEKPIYEWYGCNSEYNIDLHDNNLTGNGIIRNAPKLCSMNLEGNKLQSLYLEDCPNINPGYGFSIDGLSMESLTFNRCLEEHGQHFFGNYYYNNDSIYIKNILIENVKSLGRVFFENVKSDYIEFKNCNFSNQGCSCEPQSQVNTLCFDNCIVPSGRLDNANGNLIIKNCTVRDNWVIHGKHITISNSTIEGSYIGHFSGTEEDYYDLFGYIKRQRKSLK